MTYCHFTTPRWFAAAGGWAATDAPDRFGRFAERATEHLGDLLGRVATLNEPNVIDLLQQTGVIPMGVGAQRRRRGGRWRTATAWAWSAPASSRWPRSTARASRRSSPAPATRGGLDPRRGRPPAGRRRRGALGGGPAAGHPRLAGGVPGGRLGRGADLHPGAHRPRRQDRSARGGGAPPRPAGRSTPRPSSTPSAWPPSTPVSRSS